MSVIAIFMALVLIQLSFSPAGLANEASLNTSLIGRIYYATTRRWTGSTFDNERGKDSQHSVGVAQVLLPPHAVRWDMRRFSNLLGSLGWSASTVLSKQSKVIKCERFASLEDSFDQIEKTLIESKTDEITVAVHGYHNSFDDSILSAANFETYFKGVVIDYTWPAAKSAIPGLLHYNVAQNNVSWSQQPFTDYLRKLIDRFPGCKINIVCHSMGSRLVVGALHDLFPSGSATPKLNEVVFASPDFDAATFRNRASKALEAASKVRIYVNPKDKAMWVSAWFAGSYARAGAPGDSVESLRALPNVEVYDFGAFGGGKTGHDIPYSIISNMHKYGRPGGRWQVIRPPLRLVQVGAVR